MAQVIMIDLDSGQLISALDFPTAEPWLTR